MPNSSLNSQVVYNFAGDGKPIEVKHEDGSSQVVAFEDFQRSMTSIETASGQKILQDNQDKIRIAQNVSDAGLSLLDTGTATTAQVAAEVNKMNAILTNLVILGKQ